MGQVLIRNLKDAVIQRQRRRARRKGVSLEQHLRDMISNDAGDTPTEEWLQRLQALGARLGPLPDGVSGVDLIREGREEQDAKWRS